jgi:hypothetical protein
VTYSIKVGRTDTLLAGCNSVAGRNFLARKVLLHRSHTGVYEKEGFVIYRNERERGKSEMSLRFKE